MSVPVVSFHRFLDWARGTPPLPATLLAAPGPRLLHVSDTPAVIYPALFALIARLQPEVLVHTGDLVDQLKLEQRSFLLPLYEEQAGRFIARLEELPIGHIYLVPGNHDDPTVLARYSHRSRIVPGGSVLAFSSFRVGLAHGPERVPAGADFLLYGHSPEEPPVKRGRPLSGLAAMHVLLSTGQVYSLPYPPGTDAARRAKPYPVKL